MGIRIAQPFIHPVRVRPLDSWVVVYDYRYGNPSQMPAPLAKKYKPFAENFAASFAPQILSIYLEQTRLFVAGEAWLSKRAMYFIGQFFNEWYSISTFMICFSDFLRLK